MKGMIGGSTTASKRVASHFHIYWILEPSKNLDPQDKSKIIDHLTGHNFMNRSISNEIQILKNSCLMVLGKQLQEAR